MGNGKTLCEVFAEEERTEAAKRKNARRERIVETMRRVGKVSAAAKELGMSSAAVYSACLQAGVSVLDITREHRAVRNRELAEYAEEHGAPAACKRFGVPVTTVRDACAELGIRAASVKAASPGSTVRMVSLIMQGGTNRSVAKEVGVTHQRVSQVRRECLTYGIVTSPIRPAKNSGERS